MTAQAPEKNVLRTISLGVVALEQKAEMIEREIESVKSIGVKLMSTWMENKHPNMIGFKAYVISEDVSGLPKKL
jgi:hypothetical protein